MATRTQSTPQAASFTEPLGDLRAKTLEAMDAYAQASQRVLGQLIDLSSTAARETVRVCAELQSAAVDAARAEPVFPVPSAPTIDSMKEDPLKGYREGTAAASAGPQRLLKYLEGNAQIVAQGGQRFQVSAERGAREVGEAVTAYFERLGEIYRGK